LLPFFGALLLVLFAVTYIPALSMWLPNLLLK
jgi:TRAP-type C4-dicarboxylate transport system permease large subunit